MSQEFSSVAQSRARYYSKGSPVQFVCVELLRMEDTGDMVVTLTFKNLAPQRTLTAFTAHFRCKDRAGGIVMEDDFTYEDLSVQEGECFGGDDAVFVSPQPLSSVEVNLVSVEYDGRTRHDLTRCTPVPLPKLQPLSDAAAAAVNGALQTSDAKYMPTNVADGWQCTCGAFNYNAGRGLAMCTECGMDKAALFSAVRDALQTERTPQMMDEMGSSYLPVVDAAAQTASAPAEAAAAQDYTGGVSDGTQVFSPVGGAQDYTGGVSDGTQVFSPVGGAPDYTGGVSDGTQVFSPVGGGYDPASLDAPGMSAAYPSRSTAARRRAEQQPEVSIMKKKTADFILKYAPFITAGASAAYVLLALLIKIILR